MSESNGLVITTLKKFVVFQDLLEEKRSVWTSIIKKHGNVDSIRLLYEKITSTENISYVKKIKGKKHHSIVSSDKKTVLKYKLLDSSDILKLKTTSQLVSHFDGVVHDITGES